MRYRTQRRKNVVVWEVQNKLAMGDSYEISDASIRQRPVLQGLRSFPPLGCAASPSPAHQARLSLINSVAVFPPTPERAALYDISVRNLTYKVCSLLLTHICSTGDTSCHYCTQVPFNLATDFTSIWLYTSPRIWRGILILTVVSFRTRTSLVVLRHWNRPHSYKKEKKDAISDGCEGCVKVIVKHNKEIRERVLLNNVSARANHSELLAIAGPSGSSKTTFLDALAGQIKRKSLKGQILVNGKPMDPTFRRVSGYVTQVWIHAKLTLRSWIYSA